MDKQINFLEMRCPEHNHDGLCLVPDGPDGQPAWICPRGCIFSVVKGVPRFVASDLYAAG